MNTDLKVLMQHIAANDMKSARKLVLSMCEKEKAQSNQAFCRSISAKIQMTSSNMMELPANISGLLFKEDVSLSFRPNRFYLSEREDALTEKVLCMHRTSQKLHEAGISYMNATLLYGKSGTGKTQYGRYLAHKMGLPFCYINLSHVVDSYLGGTGKNISKVFDYIKLTPCVFMLDELDAISINRLGSSGQGAEKEMSRATISLMQNLDQLNSDIIVLAATNMIKLIDPAIRRRFPICHEVQVFSPDELVAMSVSFLEDVASCNAFPVKYSREELSRYCASGVTQSEVIYHLIQALSSSIEQGTQLHF